ncbi:leukocyte antigen CD37 isoform X2 [Trichomycterus rosablanca]|uniref:leukocyte antigen CD37 isoform X2 n=1 Tax=Trichomycterus rosablanca TaxID=2290929 RepID=UPI002F35F910
MASECCISITKYFLFLFNLIFFFLGSALLSLGLWIIFSESIFLIPAPRFLSLSLFSYLLIISGAVTMFLGFFGSLGALKEFKCMLGVYFLLLTLILAAQIIGGVLLYTQRSTFQGSLEHHVVELIKSVGKNDSSLQDFKQTLEFLQHEAECCGWKGISDWEIAPCSCYYSENITANATAQSSEICTCPNIDECKAYQQGCQGIIKKWLDEHILIILAVLAAIAVVEICGLILSMCLYRRVAEDYSTAFSR